MYGVRHPFVQEFPEYRDTIEYLKEHSREFAHLLERYQETDKKIYGYEQRKQPVDDGYMEQLKRWRVRMKDKLYAMLRQQNQIPLTS